MPLGKTFLQGEGVLPSWGICEVKSVTQCVRLLATLRTVAHQAPLSMGFSRQEYWSRLPFPSPGNLPNPGSEPQSPALQVDVLSSGAFLNLWIHPESQQFDRTLRFFHKDFNANVCALVHFFLGGFCSDLRGVNFPVGATTWA